MRTRERVINKESEKLREKKREYEKVREKETVRGKEGRRRSKAFVRRCSVRKVIFKTSQNS